mmetsp:Transcript_62963/g.103921  ORF Transcript_62963/g.103921 Transcript_62963/m.103921 type:complete len:89 (-) Transcript_62963:604-870(-)
MSKKLVLEICTGLSIKQTTIMCTTRQQRHPHNDQPQAKWPKQQPEWAELRLEEKPSPIHEGGDSGGSGLGKTDSEMLDSNGSQGSAQM